MDNPEHLDNPQDSDNLENLNYPEESDSLADLDYPEDSKSQDDLSILKELNVREDLDIPRDSEHSKAAKREHDGKSLAREPKKLLEPKTTYLAAVICILSKSGWKRAWLVYQIQVLQMISMPMQTLEKQSLSWR